MNKVWRARLVCAVLLVVPVRAAAQEPEGAVRKPGGTAQNPGETVQKPEPVRGALVTAPASSAPAPDAPGAAPVTLSAAADLTSFVGRPVVRVDLVADESLWRAAKVPLVTMRSGDAFTVAKARALLDEALASGHYATGRVAVAAEGPGVRVVVRVVPRKLVADVRADLGGAKIDRDELLREADFVAGAELTAESVEDRRQKLLRALARHGYQSAVVDIVTRETDDPDAVLVVVDVQAGAPVVLGGRKVFVFGDDSPEVHALADSYGLGTGDRADEVQLGAADVALAQRIQAAGYFQAKVSHDVVPHAGKAFLRIRIDTGPRIAIHFEGNDHFDQSALTAALRIEEDADRSSGAFVARLEDFYRARGYLDIDVRLEQRGAPDAKVRAWVFHVTERERVSVLARVYPCLREDELAHALGDEPKSASDIGREIDSFLDEDLPGADLLRAPDPTGARSLLAGSSSLPTSPRPIPIELEPYATFAPNTYDRALEHVRTLYENAGFLNVKVGPLDVLRRRCSPKSPPNECIPEALPPIPADQCTYDAARLPLPVEPLDPAFTCKPDARRGTTCEPRVVLRIPIKLGPRTFLYDVAFRGARQVPERVLLEAADLPLGDPLSVARLEAATRKVLDYYHDEGFAFAQVEYVIEPSPDHTRARVRFDITEGERVMVNDILVEGNNFTRASVILRRATLKAGEPYRQSEARKTQERVATLGVFASVDVALEAPYLPSGHKRVIIRVVERLPQYIELRPGLSTGEGVRLAAEYGNRNIAMSAIGLSGRLQLSYLPEFLIFDPTVRESFSELSGDKRFTARLTTTLTLPDVGLSPLFRANIDGLLIQDLQRGYLLRRGGIVGTLLYRPASQVQISLAQSFEYNVFERIGDEETQNALDEQIANDPSLSRLLRVPDGTSIASSQKLLATWDRRDNAFNAHTGTFVAGGVEHVDAYPIGEPDPTAKTPPAEGHFLRLTATFAGYVPITKRLTFAAQLRVGYIAHFFESSRTYPDRLFFLGGADSVRGFYQDSVAPTDIAYQAEQASLSSGEPVNPGIRGGDFMLNPRAELRIPVVAGLETALFCDTGTVYADPGLLFDSDVPEDKRIPFELRVALGTGIRWNSPVGIPLVLDVGFAVNRKSWEPVFAPHFAMGLF